MAVLCRLTCLQRHLSAILRWGLMQRKEDGLAAGRHGVVVIAQASQRFEESRSNHPEVSYMAQLLGRNALAGWLCMRSANEIFPELKDLPPLPIQEMALRLCFLYDDHDKRPEHEDIPECVLSSLDMSLPMQPCPCICGTACTRAMPIHEMALRLCFLYDDHDKRPEHEDIPECALTATMTKATTKITTSLGIHLVGKAAGSLLARQWNSTHA